MMKNRLKWMLVLVGLLCTVCACAMAEGFTVPTAQELRERFYFPQTPEGIVLDEPVIRDGYLQLIINLEKSDLEKLQFPPVGLYEFPMAVKAPADGKVYVKHNYVDYGPEVFDDAGAMDIARSSREDPGAVLSWKTYLYGTRDSDRMMFLPQGRPANAEDWTMFHWITADGEHVFEKITLVVSYSGQPEPIYLPFYQVTEKMLAPMQAYAQNAAFEKVTIRNGEVHLFMSSEAGETTVPLVLNAPSSASSAKVIDSYGWEVTEASVIDGKVSLYKEDGGNGLVYGDNETIAERAYYVIWYAANGTELYPSKLTTYVIPYANKPQFNYSATSKYEKMQGIKAVDENRLRIHNNMSNCGVTWDYDRALGLVQITRDFDVKVTGEPGALTGYVRPEKDSYKYARIVTAGGSEIIGVAKVDYAYEMLKSSAVREVDGNGLKVFTEEPLKRYKAGPVQVYLQQDPYTYGGSAILIAWYENKNDAWEEPAKMEYIHVMTDKLFVEADGVLLPHGAQITSPVEQITVVMPEDYEQKWKDWNLVIRYDPQMGINALHYEIYGTNETGAFQKIKLNEPVKLYMPYPERKDHTSKETFYLYHFNELYQQKEKLKGEKTPYGVLYLVKSFSPFVLEWADETYETSVQTAELSAADITDELKAAKLDTIEKIKTALWTAVLETEGSIENYKLYDLRLVDENGNKIEAVKEDFPMTVTMPLPQGSSSDDVFTIIHMFATNKFGKEAGKTETCGYRIVEENGVPMLQFTVSSFSPLMIAWEEPQPAAIPAVPQTGDHAALGLWMLLMMGSAACMLMLRRKHA